MFRKTSRMAALAALLVAVGAMFVAAAPASATTDFEKCVAEAAEEKCLPVAPKFVNWVVRGKQTFTKLGQSVTLPEGSTFNGSGALAIRAPSKAFPPPYFMLSILGTEEGIVAVPPFNAPLKILGIPTVVGMTFNAINPAQVNAVSAANPEECGGPIKGTEQVQIEQEVESKATCVNLSSLEKVNFGITSVSISSIKIPTQCETVKPVEFNLSTNLTLLEIVALGAHFKGTNTVPNFKCGGLFGGLLGPVLSLLISGPNNPYEFSISPH
jgi:hypothetical protein